MHIVYYGLLRDRLAKKLKDDADIRYDLFRQSGKKNKAAITLWPRLDRLSRGRSRYRSATGGLYAVGRLGVIGAVATTTVGRDRDGGPAVRSHDADAAARAHTDRTDLAGRTRRPPLPQQHRRRHISTLQQ